MVVDSPVVELRLSQEELLYVLRLAGVPTLPGLDDDAITRLSDDQLSLILTAGENALRARGLLETDYGAEKGVAVSEVVLALVGTCVMGDSLVAVRHELLSGDGDARFYHLGEDLAVEHAVPWPGVHRFTATADRQAVVQRIAQQMALVAPEGNGHASAPSASAPLVVRESRLQRARDQAVDRQDVAAAAATLREGGLSPSEAEGLAASLARLSAVTTLTYLRSKGEEMEGGGMVVLHEPQGLWVLEPGEEEDPQVECHAATPGLVQQRLAEVVGLPAA